MKSASATAVAMEIDVSRAHRRWTLTHGQYRGYRAVIEAGQPPRFLRVDHSGGPAG
jgi:hypothetical protein